MYYYYIQTDENGRVFSHFESTTQKAPSQTELIEVDTYDPTYVNRYYIDGIMGDAPREGYYWEWNTETNQPVETLIPTE
tara:strand:+ start:396 stop:632 length:237 start_codon:yes stop_codon:yes gene_type:complete